MCGLPGCWAAVSPTNLLVGAPYSEDRTNEGSAVRVDAIEAFRKKRDTAKAGDNVGLLFHRLDKGELAPGDVITSAGVFLA